LRCTFEEHILSQDLLSPLPHLSLSFSFPSHHSGLPHHIRNTEPRNWEQNLYDHEPKISLSSFKLFFSGICHGDT
jgi:hypothetical protein